MPIELKVDPARLVSLQRQLTALRAQSRGLWQQKSDAEQRRAIVDHRLLQARRRLGEWERVRAPPIGVRHPLEAQIWNEALNDRGTGLREAEQEIAELDREIDLLQQTYDTLMERVRPLAELVQACERHVGQPSRTVRGVVSNAVRDEGGAR